MLTTEPVDNPPPPTETVGAGGDELDICQACEEVDENGERKYVPPPFCRDRQRAILYESFQHPRPPRKFPTEAVQKSSHAGTNVLPRLMRSIVESASKGTTTLKTSFSFRGSSSDSLKTGESRGSIVTATIVLGSGGTPPTEGTGSSSTLLSGDLVVTKASSSPMVVETSTPGSMSMMSLMSSKKGKTPRRRFADFYVMDEDFLCESEFGGVFEGRNIVSGQRVVVKQLHKRGMRRHHLNNLYQEVDIHSSLDHPNIIKMLDVFESEDTVELILEYAEGGDLFDLLEDHSPFSERQAAEVAVQVLYSLAYLHWHNIMHRDVKLENILLMKPYRPTSPIPPDRRFHVRLADFGLAARVEPRKFLYKAGSTPYLAPEVLEGVEFGRKSDIWSLGVALYMMLMNRGLYHHKPSEIRENIVDGSFDIGHCCPNLSPECQHFLKGLLSYDPKMRPTAYQALQHPWLKRYALITWTPIADKVDLMTSFAPLKLAPTMNLTMPLPMALPDAEVWRDKADRMTKKMNMKVERGFESGMATLKSLAPKQLKGEKPKLSREEAHLVRRKKLLKLQQEERNSIAHLKIMRQGSYTDGPEEAMPDFDRLRAQHQAEETLPHEDGFDFHEAMEPELTCSNFIMTMYRRWRFDCLTGVHTGIQNLIYGKPERRPSQVPVPIPSQIARFRHLEESRTL